MKLVFHYLNILIFRRGDQLTRVNNAEDMLKNYNLLLTSAKSIMDTKGIEGIELRINDL